MSDSTLSMEPTASGSSTRLCAICSGPARYTCPGCSTSTCSLPCSRTHKSTAGCNGERNKAAYVQMNAYGWGTMMRDYCFLEEVGRNVSTWGREIAREGLATAANVNAKEMRGRGGARASGRVRGGRSGGSSKRDLLKAHLDNLDIEMDVLPVGMQRRKVNQSTYDTKTQTALLTIEFKFYPGVPSQPSLSAASATYTTVAHRNSIHSSVIDLLRRHVPQHPSSRDYSRSRKENSCPDWVISLVHPHPHDPEGFKVPHCYLPVQMDLTKIPYFRGIGTQRGPYYYKFCPSQILQELLQGTHFVEFPTIHVYDPDSSTFIGTVLTTKDQWSPMSNDEHDVDIVTKRRKLNTKAGRKAISGLVGEYGSDSESIPEMVEVGQRPDELGALGGYTESPTEDDVTTAASSSDEEEDIGELDSAALLELIKQAQGAADHDAEVVDWGDSWDEDVIE